MFDVRPSISLLGIQECNDWCLFSCAYSTLPCVLLRVFVYSCAGLLVSAGLVLKVQEQPTSFCFSPFCRWHCHPTQQGGAGLAALGPISQA